MLFCIKSTSVLLGFSRIPGVDLNQIRNNGYASIGIKYLLLTQSVIIENKDF